VPPMAMRTAYLDARLQRDRRWLAHGAHCTEARDSAGPEFS
jgi:hypothetical protein